MRHGDQRLHLGPGHGLALGATFALVASGCGRLHFDPSSNGPSADGPFADGAALDDSGTPVTGLVGWWKFDEASGLTAADSSGNGNTGTLMSGTAWQPAGGQLGGALSFTGTSAYVAVASSPSLDNLSAFTVSFWRKVSTTDGYVIAKTNSPSTTGPAVSFSSDRIYYYRSFSGGAMEALAPANTVLGTWEHYVMTTDGTPVATGTRFFKNGVLLTNSSNNNASGTLPDDTANPVELGNWDTLGSAINGSLDDLRVYNRALSVAEVQQL